jgi:PPOX class probable FMN-dependent enzyme
LADDPYRIADETALRRVIGSPRPTAADKVLDRLNEAMMAFIGQSPLMFVSTVDEHGVPEVSPKGDPMGFVEIDAEGDLLIPERPGNRLAFGFTNILRNGEIGLLFIAPHQRETLRIKGVASLHAQPEVLARMQVNGKAALLYTRVAVHECFFHCGKALIRSNLWEPDRWPAKSDWIAARQFASQARLSEDVVEKTSALMERAYKEELY